jgi:hypothetical protein
MSTPSEPRTTLARYQSIQDNLIGSSVPKRQRVCEDKWINPARPLPGAPIKPDEKYKLRIEQPRWPMPRAIRANHRTPDPSVALMKELMASIPTHLPSTPPKSHQKTLSHKRTRSNSAPMDSELENKVTQSSQVAPIIVPPIDDVIVTKFESGISISSYEEVPSPLERKIMFAEDSNGSLSKLPKSLSFQSLASSHPEEPDSKKIIFPNSAPPELERGLSTFPIVPIIEGKNESTVVTPVITPVPSPKLKVRAGFTRPSSQDSDLDQSSANSSNLSNSTSSTIDPLPRGSCSIDANQVSTAPKPVCVEQSQQLACCALC